MRFLRELGGSVHGTAVLKGRRLDMDLEYYGRTRGQVIGKPRRRAVASPRRAIYRPREPSPRQLEGGP